jgi:hypothetical protein
VIGLCLINSSIVSVGLDFILVTREDALLVNDTVDTELFSTSYRFTVEPCFYILLLSVLLCTTDEK